MLNAPSWYCSARARVCNNTCVKWVFLLIVILKLMTEAIQNVCDYLLDALVSRFIGLPVWLFMSLKDLFFLLARPRSYLDMYIPLLRMFSTSNWSPTPLSVRQKFFVTTDPRTSNPDVRFVPNRSRRRRAARRHSRESLVGYTIECESPPAQFVRQSSIDSLLPSCMKDLGDSELALVETLILFSFQLFRATSYADVAAAVIALVKQRSQGSLCGSVIKSDLLNKAKELFADFSAASFQRQSTVSDSLDSVESFISSWKGIKDSVLGKKLYEFLLYAMSHSLFDKVGVSFDSLGFSKLHADAVRRKCSSKANFMEVVADTFLYVSRIGHQIYTTRSFSGIFHCGKTYAEFFDDILALEHDHSMMNQDVGGKCSAHSLLARCDELATKGHEMSRLTNGEDRKVVRNLIWRLVKVRDTILSSNQARSIRAAPLGLLLYGPSGIGKSTFVDYLFPLMGKWFDLPASPEGGKYVVNPSSKFWDGFRSSDWFIVLDELANEHPNKVHSLKESSVANLLLLNNTLPFCPDQAAVEDKGKTPAFPRVVVGTTNQKSLQAEHFYSCPEAVRRRLPWCILLFPVARYMEGGVLSQDKISSDPLTAHASIPQVWNINVQRFVANELSPGKAPEGFEYVATDCTKHGRYYHVRKIGSDLTEEHGGIQYPVLGVRDFCRWLLATSDAHSQNQTDLQAKRQAAFERPVCGSCRLYPDMCLCPENFEKQSYSLALLSPVVVFLCALAWQLGSWVGQQLTGRLTSWLWRQFFSEISHCGRSYLGRLWWGAKRKTTTTVASTRRKMMEIGERVRHETFKPSRLVMAIAAISTTYVLTRYMLQSVGAFSTQGGPTPAEQTENVWSRSERNILKIDTTPRSKCSSLDDVAKLLKGNMAHGTAGLAGFSSEFRLLHVHRGCWVTTAHSIPRQRFQLTVTLNQALNPGPSPNRTMWVSPSDVYRVPGRDLAVIKLLSVPSRKNVLGLVQGAGFAARCAGFLASCSEDSVFSMRQLGVSSRRSMQAQFDGGRLEQMDAWFTQTMTPTQQGDCGSVLVGVSPQGVVLSGIHNAYSPNSGETCSQPLVQEELLAAIAALRSPLLSEGHVELTRQSAKKSPEIVDLGTHSPFRWIEDGVACVHGSMSTPTVRYRSKVESTPGRDFLAKEGITTEYCAPLMSGWRPKRHGLLALTDPVSEIDTDRLLAIKKSYTQSVLKALSAEALAKVRVLTEAEAVDGVPGERFLDKIKRNTSMGFPYDEAKWKYMVMVEPNEVYQHPAQFIPEVYEEMARIVEAYKSENRFHAVFQYHLKDEPVSTAKRASGKTRIFSGAPVAFSLVVRQQLLTFVQLVQENSYVFESAPGINPMSDEWATLHDYLIQFGEDRIVAGDYSKYDKRMPAEFMFAAFDIILDVLRACPNFDLDERLIWGIASDTCHPLGNYFGDLVTFLGSNPSGHPLTVIVNGLANSLFVRYGYSLLNPSGHADDFKKHVSLMTYGDDNIMGVSRDAPWFNHTALASALSSLGMVYTMADKEAESVPYISIRDADFLKRGFIPYKGRVSCPLVLTSIEKSLCVWVKSKTEVDQDQYTSVVASAVREYFQYGPERFRLESDRLRRLLHHLDYFDQGWVPSSTFPTYDALEESMYGARNVPPS